MLTLHEQADESVAARHTNRYTITSMQLEQFRCLWTVGACRSG